MSPEGLSVRLRRRAPWEAAELGLALVRENFSAVMRPWCFLGGLWAGLCGILCHSGHPTLALLLFWWPLPLLERVIIHVLSRRAFGPAPGFWESLRAWPGSLRHGWLASLFLWRFLPQRAFFVPVCQLECLSGQSASQRRSVLRRDGDKSFAWGLIYAHIEGFCAYALFVFLLSNLPFPDDFLWTLWETFARTGNVVLPAWFSILSYWCAAFTIIMLRPAYVAGSFTLYLNRRMELEGWDLELAFRRLAARLAKAAAALVLGFLCLFAPQRSEAVSEAAPPSVEVSHRPANAQDAVRQVMSDPEFESVVSRKAWVWNSPDDKPQKKSASRPSPASEALFKVTAYALLALALLVVVRLLVSWFRHVRLHFPAGVAASPAAPSPVLRGRHAVSTEEVFGNVPEEAWKLWQAGDRRAALGLLYRGSLHELTLRHRLELPGSLTEGECVRAVRARAPGPGADYLRRVAICWQGLAYAHLEPRDHEVRALCSEWAENLPRKEPAP